MRDRRKFSTAVAAATAFMSTLYVMLAVTGYAVLGDSIDVDSPVTSALPQDVWSVVSNVGLFVHCILAYQVGRGLVWGKGMGVGNSHGQGSTSV